MAQTREKVYQACAVCAATGRTAADKKKSLTDVHQAFKQELQGDFMMVHIADFKFEVMSIIDTAIRYGEREI